MDLWFGPGPFREMVGHTIRTISAVMRLDTAVEVTASEQRVELMFPADEESDAYFRLGPPNARVD